MNVDNNYYKGSLLLGCGLIILGLMNFIYGFFHHEIPIKWLIPVFFSSLFFVYKGYTKMAPKIKIWRDKEKKSLYYDEHEMHLQHQATITGFGLGLTIIAISLLLYKSERLVPTFYIEAAIWFSFGVKHLHYWWLSRESFKDELGEL